MVKQSILFIFLFLFSFTLISAEQIGQRQDANLNEPYIISQPCATCTYVNISVFNEEGLVLDNVAMVNNGSTWTYIITPNVSSRHDVNGIGDINGLEDSFAFYFNVEPINVSAVIFLLIFFCSIIVGLVIVHKRTNFEKWHDKILNSDKTFIKSALAGIPYTFMKDIYLVYYLLGFPILFLITDLIVVFNILSIAYMLDIFFKIYTVGMVIPGIALLGDMVRILQEIWENIQNQNWGVN